MSLFITRPCCHFQIWKNIRFHGFENGYRKESLERQLLETGDSFLYAKELALAAMPVHEERYGELPFRVSSPVFGIHFGFTIPKFVDYKEEVRAHSLRLIEAGIVQRLTYSFIRPRFLLKEQVENVPVAFTPEHILGPVLFLCGGLAISLLTFIYELLQHKTTSRTTTFELRH